jgi:hypothetical protein
LLRLRIARRLQPRAKRVVVIGGTAPYDEMQLDPARAALQADRIGLPVKYPSAVRRSPANWPMNRTTRSHSS